MKFIWPPELDDFDPRKSSADKQDKTILVFGHELNQDEVKLIIISFSFKKKKKKFFLGSKKEERELERFFHKRKRKRVL